MKPATPGWSGKRQQVEGLSELPLAAGALGPWSPDPDNPDVYVRGGVPLSE